MPKQIKKRREHVVFCEANDCMSFGRILIEMADRDTVLLCDYHTARLIEWHADRGIILPITFYQRLDPRRIEDYLEDKSTTRRTTFGK